MKINISKKYILIVTLVLLFVFFLLMYQNKVTEWIKQKIEEVKMASTEDTTINYEIISEENGSLQTLIIIENSNGIDKIITQDMTLNCNGKTKVAMDRELQKNECVQLRVQLVNGETSELFTLMKASDFNVIKEDETTTTLEIEYADNENLINYYSLDQGETWQIYTEPLNIPTINNYVILARTEAKEGKIIQITESSYPYIVADSLLSATKNSISNPGYYRIAVKDEEYYVHAYVEDTDLTISETTTYGDENDIATENEYAKHMVILKVNGNLTIEQEATLTAYSSPYGGPKGMLVYTSNTLTNNGTISMTAKGAKAEGENVYLWTSSDGSYEYVPAVGATGGERKTASRSHYYSGNDGNPGEGRQTRWTVDLEVFKLEIVVY